MSSELDTPAASWMAEAFDDRARTAAGSAGTKGIDSNGYDPNSYDSLMFSPVIEEYFEFSDFCNWGYWLEDTTSQKQACETLMEKLLSLVPAKRGAALDVACGKGATTRHLLRYYPPEAVTGINLSKPQLARARQIAPGCRFEFMDATDLEFDDRTFDLVICVEAAFHFDTRETFFEEAHRVLRPGGRLVVSDILFRPFAHSHGRSLDPHNYVADPDHYSELLEAAGFDEPRVIDASEECWLRYERHHAGWFVGRRVAGQIDPETFNLVARRRRHRLGATTHYVLAAGRRP